MGRSLGLEAALVSLAIVAASLVYLIRIPESKLRDARTSLSSELLATLLLTAMVCFLWLGFMGSPTKRVDFDLYPTYVAGKLWIRGVPEAVYYTNIYIDANAHPEWKREV